MNGGGDQPLRLSSRWAQKREGGVDEKKSAAGKVTKTVDVLQ